MTRGPGIRPRCGSAVRLVESCRPPDERGLHTPPAKTTWRGAIHELVGVAEPLPARSPLPPRQLPERKAVLCVGLEYLLVSLYVGAEFLGSSRDDIGWYIAVRDGLIVSYLIPANTNFLA